jgi:signal peptidase I
MIAEEKTYKSGNKPPSCFREVLGWVEAVLIALVVSFLIRDFLFVTTVVNMHSMEDTLFDGQRIIIYKLGYRFALPVRGDIVVFEYQERSRKGLLKYLPLPDPQEINYIKRVVALPGEEVDIRDGHVYINGVMIEEPYVKGVTAAKGMTLPDTVPENKIMVLGDNREISSDSREIGYIDISRMKGKAVFRILPLRDFGGIYGNIRQDR